MNALDFEDLKKRIIASKENLEKTGGKAKTVTLNGNLYGEYDKKQLTMVPLLWGLRVIVDYSMPSNIHFIVSPNGMCSDLEGYVFDLEKLTESLLVTSDYYRDYLERYKKKKKKHGFSPVEDVDL